MKLLRPSQFILVLVCLNIGLGFAFLMRFLLTDLEAQTLQATEEIMVDVSSRMAQQVEQQIDAGAVFNANLCLALYPEEEAVLEREVQIYGKKKAGVMVLEASFEALKQSVHLSFMRLFNLIKQRIQCSKFTKNLTLL